MSCDGHGSTCTNNTAQALIARSSDSLGSSLMIAPTSTLLAMACLSAKHGEDRTNYAYTHVMSMSYRWQDQAAQQLNKYIKYQVQESFHSLRTSVSETVTWCFRSSSLLTMQAPRALVKTGMYASFAGGYTEVLVNFGAGQTANFQETHGWKLRRPIHKI